MGFGAAGTERAGVRRGGNPDVAREQALEMVRGIADRTGECVEPRRFLGRLDQRHRFGHRLAIASDLVRAAAQAGAIARRARFARVREKFDMVAFGVARGAARLAIDAGRADRADELSVAGAVAGFESGPALVGIEHGMGLGDIR